MQWVAYGGWERCARWETESIEVVVTAEVGPRVIHLARRGGPNEFAEAAEDMGTTGGEKWKPYGGHRLWIAPEDEVTTYQPDNDPVEHRSDGPWEVFATPTDRFGIQKEIGINVEGDRVGLRHRIYNRGQSEKSLFPWALSVMAPGGECIVPHAPYRPFPEQLLPARPLVLWPYTRMDDSRWTWGPGALRLRQDASAQIPQKAGMLVQQGLAVYANHENLFVKRFGFEEGGQYPDFGCNFETYTDRTMLEVESLGPGTLLGPGEHVDHFETWYLLGGETAPAKESVVEWLDDLAQRCPHVAPDI